MKYTALLMVLASVTFLARNVTAQPPAYRPVVGEVHQDIEFPNIETGEKVRLSNFRGKKVLLIHFASW